jgi:hypothetical protein
VHHERAIQTWRWNDRAGVRRRVHVLRTRRWGELTASSLCLLQKLEALGDGGVAGIELSGSGVGVYSVVDLVITALVQGAKVEPDFGDIRVDANGTGVSIEGVAVLVDLEVQNADGAPERRVSPVAIDSLLVCFIRLVVLGSGHIRTTEQVPALRIRRI